MKNKNNYKDKIFFLLLFEHYFWKIWNIYICGLVLISDSSLDIFADSFSKQFSSSKLHLTPKLLHSSPEYWRRRYPRCQLQTFSIKSFQNLTSWRKHGKARNCQKLKSFCWSWKLRLLAILAMNTNLTKRYTISCSFCNKERFLIIGLISGTALD